jgi:hypothetical protein
MQTIRPCLMRRRRRAPGPPFLSARRPHLHRRKYEEVTLLQSSPDGGRHVVGVVVVVPHGESGQMKEAQRQQVLVVFGLAAVPTDVCRRIHNNKGPASRRSTRPLRPPVSIDRSTECKGPSQHLFILVKDRCSSHSTTTRARSLLPSVLI